MNEQIRTSNLLRLLCLLLPCFPTMAMAQVGSGLSNSVAGLTRPAYQFTDGSEQSYSPSNAALNSDPVQALEARVNSLQREIESMRAIGNCVNNDACNTNSRGGLYLGAAAVFAKPHFKEAFQHSETNLVTGLQTLVPFEYGYESTPRAWVGFKFSNGTGIRVSYWGFHGNGQTQTEVADGLTIYGAHAVSIIFPANIFAINPGEVLQSADSLNTQTINYYGTYDTTIGSFEVSGGVGLRNARLEQRLDSVVLDPMGAPIRQLSWQREFNGLGPSVTIDIKRRIGCSPFSAFTQAGGALLFGTKSLNRTVFGDQSPQPATPFLSLEDADEVVGVGEMNFGFEWSKPLASGHQFSVRGLYEGQLWAEAGAPTIGFLGFEGFGIQAELKR
jgi:hypothetical protein